MLTCDTPGCTEPVVHADKAWGKARGWCEEHTPWSGHSQHCPDWCGQVLAETKTTVRERVPLTSREDKAERRLLFVCSCCPPNRNENATRQPKHGVKKKRKTR